MGDDKTKEKVTKLTQEQIDRSPEWVEKWKNIGLCTDPINFDDAFAALKKCYKCSELSPPSRAFYLESPMAATVAFNLLDDNTDLSTVKEDWLRGRVLSVFRYGENRN